MDNLLNVLAFLYAATGVIALFWSFPTIRDLLAYKASANVSSYVIRTFCHGVSFLYAVLMISDRLLTLVVWLNFAAVVCVLVLSLRLRYFRKNLVEVE